MKSDFFFFFIKDMITSQFDCNNNTLVFLLCCSPLCSMLTLCAAEGWCTLLTNDLTRADLQRNYTFYCKKWVNVFLEYIFSEEVVLLLVIGVFRTRSTPCGVSSIRVSINNQMD
uniref:Uncharacterized protein n=1 Tax=Octopus bimaculoides TaxID=37653 RepID=A0A0L8HX19_OCTBM